MPQEKSSEESGKFALEITLDPKPASIVDIGSVISKRLRAMKDLQENPNDLDAKGRLENATVEVIH